MRSRVNLGRSDTAASINHLAGKIGEFDGVGIDQREAPRAGARQRPQCGNAESSQADDQYSLGCHFGRASRSGREPQRRQVVMGSCWKILRRL